MLVLAAAAAALFLPTGTELTATLAPDGSSVIEEERSTTTWGDVRAGDEEWFVVVVVLLPAAVALGALVLDRTRIGRASRIGAAVLLSVFAVLALASVGFFFLPGALAMVVAAALPG